MKHILGTRLLLASFGLFALGSAHLSHAGTLFKPHEIILEGLQCPAGIAINGNRYLIFSEVPSPGVFGGDNPNTVKVYRVPSGRVDTISVGEPYPRNIAIDANQNIYWTCQTAGVILRFSPRLGAKSVFLPVGFDPSAPADPENPVDFLMSPSGIAIAPSGEVLFTEVPSPGVFNGNLVSVSDGVNISTISDFEPEPNDIVVGPDGTAYWTCTTAGVIFQRSPAGVASVLMDGLDAPMGIAIHPRGRYLYFTLVPVPGVADFELLNEVRNRVIEYDLVKKKMSIVSEGFPYPKDVTVSRDDIVYWTCKTAGVIAAAKAIVQTGRHSLR